LNLGNDPTVFDGLVLTLIQGEKYSAALEIYSSVSIGVRFSVKVRFGVDCRVNLRDQVRFRDVDL
jgi:hypothetical protein